MSVSNPAYLPLLKVISYLALALCLIPAFLVFGGMLDLTMYKNLLLAGTLLWIVTAPFWVNRSA